MFRFKYRQVDILPRLAWCAQLQRGSDEILVEHGPWVETHDGFFAEGAWDRPFADGDLADALALLGSGGTIAGAEAVFCTTTHTMERLHSIRIGDTLWLSNSFAYLLEVTADAPDVNYRYYERDFMTFLRGRRRALRSVPTLRDRQVQLHYGERLFVDRDLGIRAQPFPAPPRFANYADYIAKTEAMVKRLHDNANDPLRKIRYQPLSTLSSGYDSPACTVIAKSIGCRRAITLLKAREHYYSADAVPGNFDDSGAAIAHHLGIELTPFSRDAYLERDDYPEAEFLATGNGGDDVVLAAAEAELPRTMLFTGFLGDTLWGLDGADPKASRDYAYTFPAGGTFGEFRLRVGFVHVPVPLLTFTRHEDVLRISRSAEMGRWCVGGVYDRPIPRRLVETAGVPREIYAREKKAVTQPFWLPVDPEHIRAMMSRHSYADLVAFADDVNTVSGLTFASRLKTAVAPVAAPLAANLNWYGEKLRRAVGIKLLPQLATGQFRPSVLFGTPAGLKFHWAVGKVRARYTGTELGEGGLSGRRGHTGRRRSSPAAPAVQ